MSSANATLLGLLAFVLAIAPCPAHGVELHGFVDARAGIRLSDDPYEKDGSLAETRLQLELDENLAWGSLKLKGDLLGDAVTEEARPELREANLLFSPLSCMDVKVGRQPLTWGTGDLLFINDLFPKDWEAFFIGRDTEYLKAPTDAIKAGLFFDFASVDLVYAPLFNGSTYIDGSRLSYWNPQLGRIAGRDNILADQERVSFPTDNEFAVRIYKNIASLETAVYGYHGFWKTPEGMDAATGELIYPRLAVYGASLRGVLFGGIGNLEAGYYDSRQDPNGADPLIRNSEWRFLAGLERELGADFTGSLQYYLEWMQDHAAYESTAGTYAKDEYRQVVTLRLTRLLLRQNLRLSFFAYYSPSDEDGYLRPNLHYRISDQWAAEAGGNIFFGAADHTFFGQFKDNNNLYAGVRRTF
jgi:hypothetical protein